MYRNRILIFPLITGIVVVAVLVLIVSNLKQRQTTLPPLDQTINMIGYTYTPLQMQRMITAYENANPHITINYTQIDKSSYDSYLIQRFHSTNSAIIPDVFEANSTNQNIYLKYSHVSPADVMTVKDFTSTYYPLYDRGLIYNNAYVTGIPEDMSPLILLYNKSLIQQLGYNMANITSDFDTFNFTIANIAKKETKIAALNVGSPTNIENAADILQLFMLENNTLMNSNRVTASFNTSQGIGALRYYKSFITGDFTDNFDKIAGSATDYKLFADGKLVMIFAHPEDITKILSINPKLAIGTAVYPTLQTPMDIATYNYLGVYTNTPRLEAAWKFIAFLGSKSSEQYFSTINAPSNGYGIISPRVDNPLSLQDPELQKTLTSAAVHSQDWSIPGQIPTRSIFTDLINTYLISLDPQTSLNLAVQQINAQIQKDLSL